MKITESFEINDLCRGSLPKWEESHKSQAGVHYLFPKRGWETLGSFPLR